VEREAGEEGALVKGDWIGWTSSAKAELAQHRDAIAGGAALQIVLMLYCWFHYSHVKCTVMLEVMKKTFCTSLWSCEESES
jgi:hypothetical protein